MIRTKKEKKDKRIIIDLSGPDGNVFYLIAQARKWARDLGWDEEQITKEMQSGKYENALRVFDSYFGHFVILERRAK